MVRPPRLAAERTLALAVAFAAALGGQTATAQEDPFALPKGLTAQSAATNDGPGLSEIDIDGEVRSRLVKLAWQNGALAIDAEAARAAGLPVAPQAGGMVPLKDLKIAKWTFDAVRQRLEVQLLRKSDRGNLLDLAVGPKTDGVSAPLTALRVDYDLTGSLIRGKPDAGGLVEAALVRGNAALTAAFQLASSPSLGIRPVVRLNTQVQIQFPGRGLTATAGDFISAGGQSQRALRLGGLQFATDYSLRPDVITTPLPSFTGQVAVPTGIDLIQGDQRYKLGEIQPGEFTVRNVPATAGRGEIGVITRDALGREVLQTTRFYVSRNLLARNLSEFAVNAGFVRRRYGARSMDYGPLAASIYYRRGLSSRLTVEGTAEWTSGLGNVGARGDVVLGGIAMATLEARYSHGAGSSGTLLNVGIESTGRRLSGRIAAVLPSKGYNDTASRLGDALPAKQFLGQLNFDLGHNTLLQVSATRQQKRPDPRYPTAELKSDVFNASFRTQLRRGVDLFASGGYRNGATRAFTGFAGISLQLGGGRTAQASVSGGSGQKWTGSSSVARHDIEGTPLGYAFDRSYGLGGRTAASVSYRSDYGRVEGQVERVNGQFGFRTNARGTLIAAGGAVFARNQTGGSYALVRTGRVGGITVMRENRPAGVTARNGVLLVENIPAQIPISFDVDADKLPNDAMARDVKKQIVVPRRAVGLVALDVIRFVPRQIRLTGTDGAPLPTGTPLKAMPSGEPTMVGFDGVVDWNAGGSDRALITTGDGAICVAQIDSAALAALSDGAALQDFVCRSAPAEEIALLAQPGKSKRPSRHGVGGVALASSRHR